MMKPVDSDHYQALAIQPIEFIEANALDFNQGNVVKYVCRYQRKGGLVDLEKAKYYLERLIERYKDK